MNIEYEEINLIDYIKVIFRKKKIILVFILIGLILAWAITLSLPKTYKAETILEIGGYDQRLDSLFIFLEIISPVKFAEKINLGLYGNYPGLKAKTFENTNLITITVSSNNTKEAENSLKSLNQLILKNHNQKIEKRKQNLEKYIKLLENKIESLIWQGRETASLELEVHHLRNQIESLQMTEIIRKPTIIFGREPNLGLNLIFGAVLGAFVGIFFILSREWWGKNKEKLKT